MRRPWPTRGCCAIGKKYLYIMCDKNIPVILEKNIKTAINNLR
jgi:hypothetical protein